MVSDDSIENTSTESCGSLEIDDWSGKKSNNVVPINVGKEERKGVHGNCKGCDHNGGTR